MQKKKESTLKSVRSFKETFDEMQNLYKEKLKEKQLSQKLVVVKDRIKKWETKRNFIKKTAEFDSEISISDTSKLKSALRGSRYEYN